MLQQGRHAKRRQHAMDQAAHCDPQAGGDPGGPPLGRAPGDHIGHVGAGGEVEGKGSCQERQQLG